VDKLVNEERKRKENMAFAQCMCVV